MKLYFKQMPTFILRACSYNGALICSIILLLGCTSKHKNDADIRNIKVCLSDVIFHELEPNTEGTDGIQFILESKDDELNKVLESKSIEKFMFWENADKKATGNTADELRHAVKVKKVAPSIYELKYGTLYFYPVPPYPSDTSVFKTYSAKRTFNKDSLMLNSQIRIIAGNGKVWNIKPCTITD